MTFTRVSTLLTGLAIGTAAVATAQQPADSPRGLPSRNTTAVTYEARRTTKIDLVGTPLLPRPRGEAEIKTENSGPAHITAKMKGLSSPGQFGPEYLTYV